MIMESGKIYLRKHYKNYILCPSIQTTDDIKVYVSDSSSKPNSINEMVELGEVRKNYINTIMADCRWIAVTYSNGEVYEMGLIQYPFITELEQQIIIEPEEVTIDGKKKLYIDNNETSLLWE